MIYRLFRKELITRTSQLTSPAHSESSYIEEVSHYLKFVKRKQLLYLKLIQSSNYGRQPLSEHLEECNRQFESCLTENKKIESTFRQFEHEEFYNSKTYAYTLFMRIRQIFDTQGKRFKVKGKNNIEKMFEEGINDLAEIYGNQTYTESYNIFEIMNYVNKHQNRRIYALLPRKSLTSLALERPDKLLEKLKSRNTGKSMLRKTISVELVKTKQSQLESAVNKKLIIHELATEKRLRQRKVKQKKGTLFNLYSNVLEVKTFPDITVSNKETFQEGMIQRNRQLKQGIKQFEKKYLLFKYCRKDKQ